MEKGISLPGKEEVGGLIKWAGLIYWRKNKGEEK